MLTFNYRARDNTGKLVRGAIEAATKEEVAEKLLRMGYAPVTISKVIAGLKLEQLGRGFSRISNEDIIMFNLQLANMLNSGLSIMTCLDTLERQTGNKRFKETIGSVSRAVEGGMSFSQALAEHPRVFSPLFVSMVRAGETSGKLDMVLNRHAQFVEAQADLQQKIRGALFYPAILIVAASFIIVFMVTSVVPKFVEIFSQAGLKLPVPTIILYTSGIFIRRFWYLIILAGILIVFALKRYIRTKRGKFRFDRISLRLPVVGLLVRRTCVSRFARTLSTLITSGVPILKSLDIVREVVNNEVLGGVIKQMRDGAEKGERLAQSLKVSEEFPQDTVQMISVGEESGNLEGMLDKISDFYDRAIGYSIKRLATVIEPVFLVVMGAVVAFIMASMLLPMFDMVKTIHR